MTTHQEIPGGWRHEQLLLVAMGVQPLEQTLHVIGVRGAGDLRKRAEQDMADATQAWAAGDQYTATQLIGGLAITVAEQRGPNRRTAA